MENKQEMLEKSWKEDNIITYLVNKYERIWRFCVGPYVEVKPDKQRLVYLARLRDEIQQAKNNIVHENTRFGLEELDKATRRDYPLFTIEEKKGMTEWLQRYLNFPEYATHTDDVHEITGTAVLFMEKAPLFDKFTQKHHFLFNEPKNSKYKVASLNKLLIYYEPQTTCPYWTLFNNKLLLHGSVFWIFGLEQGIMKSQPYSQDALKFIMRRVNK